MDSLSPLCISVGGSVEQNDDIHLLLYTTKHKKQTPTAKLSAFYKKLSVTDYRTPQSSSTRSRWKAVGK